LAAVGDGSGDHEGLCQWKCLQQAKHLKQNRKQVQSLDDHYSSLSDFLSVLFKLSLFLFFCNTYAVAEQFFKCAQFFFVKNADDQDIS
jgi:hypothetical protein